MTEQTTSIEALKGGAKVPAKTFPAMLEQYEAEIARALPQHLSPKRMTRIALTCFRQTPKLAECAPASVFAAVVQAAQLGLEPGLLGHAYLIPYGRQCQLIPGYQGLIDLALRSGRVKSIAAHAVHANDEFDYQYGSEPFLKHKPVLGDRGQIIAFYATAKLDTGDTVFEVMSKAEVDQIASKTQSRGKSGPWADYYSEMGRKTAVRRLFKYLPKSVEMATAMEFDRVASEGKAQNITVETAIEGSWVPVDEDGVIQDGGDGSVKAGAE